MPKVEVDTDKYIIIPKEVMKSFETIEELEGWLIAHNQELIAQLDESMGQYKSGEVKTIEEI